PLHRQLMGATNRGQALPVRGGPSRFPAAPHHGPAAPLVVGPSKAEDMAMAAPVPSTPRRPPQRKAAAERGGPRVDRSLRGVPDVAPWKNPTLWLFVIAAALITWASAGYLNGSMPAAVTVVISALGIYLGFTVLHESVHRLVH